MLRGLCGIVLSVLMFMAGPAPAWAGQTGNLAFLIPDTNTKVLSEGIAEFYNENAKLASRVKISVYNDQALADKSKPADLAGQDVIFLYHLSYKIMLALEPALKAARQRGTRVIGIGGYEIFKRKGYFNVDLDAHPDLAAYWGYSGARNAKGLIGYLLNRFCGFSELTITAPAEQPIDGLFHPDAPGGEVFASLSDYRAWYDASGHKKQGPWVGIVSYNVIKTGHSQIQATLIRQLEKQGLNVICAIGYPADMLIEKYLLADAVKIDLLVSLMFSHPKEKAQALLARLNIPVIRGISLYSELEKWATDPQGIEPFQLASQIFMPELCGLIEPIVLGGKHVHMDEKTGIEVTEKIPQTERIAKLSARVKAWLNLRTKKNADKKVALLYYNNPPGKHNIYASYLDVFASMQALLESMHAAGYLFEEDQNFSKAVLQDLILKQGRNIGTWAPGEMDKLIKSGRISLVPMDVYKQWFADLPRDFHDQVIAKWGPVEETSLMSWTDPQGKKFLVIPGITLGNIFIGPQPARGWLQESARLYHDMTLPPHHQYLAFYFWLKKEFGVDAIIHFGKHGTLEWTPGKQVGLSQSCSPDVLMQDVPDIYPYLMDDVGEGTQAKRRGYAVIISHMVPALKQSGLYKEYAVLHNTIHLYLETKKVTPQVAEGYKQEVIKLSRELGIEKDLGVTIDDLPFEEFQKRLHDYIHEMEYMNIPYGLHILGRPLSGEALASTVNAMLGVESDIPALGVIIGQVLGKDYLKVKANAHKYCDVLDRIETLAMDFVGKIVLEQVAPEDAARRLFADQYGQCPQAVKTQLKKAGGMAARYAADLIGVDLEIKNTIRALSGEFIAPGPGNDPIRAPDALPTGKNFYGFDPQRVPTKVAWTVGQKMAEDLIADHKQKHGRYPDKVALILWATETLRHHGVMEAKALALLGARPIWDGRGILKGVELIPQSELGRPRIDILVNASGLYRDVFPMQIGLIDDAVQLAIADEQGKHENFARLHTLEAEKIFAAKGFSDEEATAMARYRIFGAPNQGYGTGLGQAVPASGSWDDEKKLADLYVDRLNFAYGRKVWGKKSRAAFTEALKGTDVVIHSRSTNLFGVLDNDDVYQYMGGMAMAVRNLSGEEPELLVSDNRDPSAPGKMVAFSKFMGLETRGRYFNPKWITGMKEHGYSGALKMSDFVEYLWGWQVTVPKEVTQEMWQQVSEVYVNDKYKMDLKKFFEKNSPHAFQSITARIMEVDRKGYQKFDEKMLQQLAAEYVESVADQGLACCEHTCNNIALNQFAATILSVPGLVSPATMLKFQHQVKLTTGKDVRNPDWVKKSQNRDAKTAMAPDEAAREAGQQKIEDVKGYEMKEKKDEKATEISSSGASLSAILLVVVIVAIIGRGFWKGLRK
ncbi:putative hydrogenobyrinic acid a,c-diamide cobaltochelatase [Desulfosarcina variabilis str. Montpellier]|uniref:cobaltochelatase subunit CobN n=1 Tax=Desulfosarcina variabilis TaxID=2300 RepID=UPI003AFB5DBB